MNLELGKIPPQASDLEEAVLGAIMLESDCFEDVSLVLKPESFYKIEHQSVFSAMTDLYNSGSAIDILTVTQQLKKNGKLELCGGPYYVSQLTDRVGSSANAEYHARIIQQKFIARELIRVSGGIQNKAFEDTTDALDLLDEANSAIAEVGYQTGIGNRPISNQDLVFEVISDAERAASGSEIVGLPTPVPDADKLTGGYEGGKFYILAARPAMGKSSKALHDAYHISVILEKPVLFFSLEMPAKELMLRIMSLHTDTDAWKIKNGRLSEEEWGILNASVQEIIDSPLEIVDQMFTLTDIRKKAILKKKNGLAAIFIDYLQLVKNKESGRNREQEISEISREFKSLSKLLDVPVIALSQLSRAVETRGGSKKPMLSDLRESGSLEQDADQVHFLYRPEYYGIEISEEFGGTTEGLTELIVAKNRGGSTGTAPMRFHKQTTSFSPWEGQSFSASPLPSKSISQMDEAELSYGKSMPKSNEFGSIDEEPF